MEYQQQKIPFEKLICNFCRNATKNQKCKPKDLVSCPNFKLAGDHYSFRQDYCDKVCSCRYCATQPEQIDYCIKLMSCKEEPYPIKE